MSRYTYLNGRIAQPLSNYFKKVDWTQSGWVWFRGRRLDASQFICFSDGSQAESRIPRAPAFEIPPHQSKCRRTSVDWLFEGHRCWQFGSCQGSFYCRADIHERANNI